MARLRKGDNFEGGNSAVSFSSDGKHQCYLCEHSNESFCRPIGRFGYHVTDTQCERIKNGEPPIYNIIHITDDFLKSVMDMRGFTKEDFIKELKIGHVGLKLLENGSGKMSDSSKQRFVDKMNKYL